MMTFLRGAVLGALVGLAATAGYQVAAESTISTTGPWTGVPALFQGQLNQRFAAAAADIEALQAGTTMTPGAVTSAAILDGTILNEDIADGQITLAKLATGLDAYGQATPECGVDGNFTIAHGLTGTPVVAFLQQLGDDEANDIEVEGIDATNIIGRCSAEYDGADVTSGTVTVMWYARIAP